MNNICNQNRVTLFNIATNLKDPELGNLCQTHKQCNQRLCQSDEFWKYKVHQRFGGFTFVKSEEINYKEYYTYILSLLIFIFDKILQY